jgi:hypothetical protein
MGGGEQQLRYASVPYWAFGARDPCRDKNFMALPSTPAERHDQKLCF